MEDRALDDGGALTVLLAVVALLLGAKMVATLILLRRPASTRLGSRSGRILWWTTKVTPVIAVPLMILCALQENQAADVPIYLALLAFVLVAVPWKVWRHRVALGLVTPPFVAAPSHR